MGQVIPFPSSSTNRIPVEQRSPDWGRLLAGAILAEALKEKLDTRGVELTEDAILQLVDGIARELGYA